MTRRAFPRKPPRLFCDNAEYFLTFNTFRRQKLDFKGRRIVYDSIIFTAKRHKLDVFCFVVMPDHVHILVRVNRAQQISLFINRVKSYTSFRLKTLYRQSDPVWLRGTYDRVVRNDQELEAFYNYIIYNPVKHGYVDDPGEWDALWSV